MTEIQALSREGLHLALAVHCDGQTCAGVFHGHTLMHPQGLRTSAVPLADYTGDWNHAMRLAFRYHIPIDITSDDMRAEHRALCEQALWAATRKDSRCSQ